MLSFWNGNYCCHLAADACVRTELRRHVQRHLLRNARGWRVALRRSHTGMDKDLVKIVQQALDEAKAAGCDHGGQTEYAVAKVLELRHDMTASDALNAVNLVRSFL